MSGDLSNKKLKESYRDLLHVNNSNSGVSTSLKPITTGNGDMSALNLSTTSAMVKATDNTTAFMVRDASSSNIFLVDTTNKRVKVGSTQVDAGFGCKEFGLFTDSFYF